jgi:TolB-like protein/DNA-binding winged helix-turn-helix (wHTH) protein/lipopolysaccharide biosynthesis regulator YciM
MSQKIVKTPIDEPNKPLYEFGPFSLDTAELVLHKYGQPLALTPKAIDVLLLLVEHHGRVVAKGELMDRVWADSFVEEGNLKATISMIRKVLDEGTDERSYIETVAKRGYRFVAEVKAVTKGQAGPARFAQTESTPILEEERSAGVQDPPKALPMSQSNRPIARRLMICFVVLALGSAGYYLLRRPGEPAAGAVKSIAVLPFKPLAESSGDEYLELGMADTLITRLSNIKQIIVRPTSAVRKYKGLEQDSLAAGRELQVESVLEGNIQKLNDRVRVTVRLVRVADGSPLWADQFDEKLTDIFAVQDAISKKVVGALELRLSNEEKEQMGKRYTANNEAYQLYLAGRYFWNKRDLEGIKKAVEYFQQAIQLDPNYALAYTGLADACIVSPYPFPRRESLARAKDAATKALELDDRLAEAHTSFASVIQDYDWNFSGAEKEYRRALELNPNYATAHQWYAEYLTMRGRTDEALIEMQRAQMLDPQSIMINRDIGLVLFHARQYDQAIEHLHKTVEMDPTLFQASDILGRAYEQKGRFEEAIAVFEKERVLAGGSSPQIEARTAASLKTAYATAGARGYWQKWLDLSKEDLRKGQVESITLAELYATLGDRDQAFAWLEKAYEKHAQQLPWITVNPYFDGLRQDPRYADLLRRIGLPQ